MEDFYAAAQRHFKAADTLYSQAQPEEATHLYAYAAECILKAILKKQNQKVTHNHINDHLVPRKKPKPDLVSEYQSLQSGRTAFPLPSGRADWFEGWTIESRYTDASEIQSHLAAHKTDAAEFQQLVQSAIKQGLLP